MRSAVVSIVALMACSMSASEASALPRSDTGDGANHASWRTAYVTRTQPMTANWVVNTLAKSYPNDPRRCVAFGFVQWTRIGHAFEYYVLVKPPLGTGRPPVELAGYDSAKYQQLQGRDIVIVRNPPPPTKYVTSIGTISWSAAVARILIGSYSTGEGCREARREMKPWTVLRARAILSLHVHRLARKTPPPSRFGRPPRHALMTATRVHNSVLRQDPTGAIQRLRAGDWVMDGDVLMAADGATATLRMVRRGRLGFVGDRALLIVNETQALDIGDGEPLARRLGAAVRNWRRTSLTRAPLQVAGEGDTLRLRG